MGDEQFKTSPMTEKHNMGGNLQTSQQYISQPNGFQVLLQDSVTIQTGRNQINTGQGKQEMQGLFRPIRTEMQQHTHRRSKSSQIAKRRRVWPQRARPVVQELSGAEAVTALTGGRLQRLYRRKPVDNHCSMINR